MTTTATLQGNDLLLARLFVTFTVIAHLGAVVSARDVLPRLGLRWIRVGQHFPVELVISEIPSLRYCQCLYSNLDESSHWGGLAQGVQLTSIAFSHFLLSFCEHQAMFILSLPLMLSSSHYLSLTNSLSNYLSITPFCTTTLSAFTSTSHPISLPAIILYKSCLLKGMVQPLPQRIEVQFWSSFFVSVIFWILRLCVITMETITDFFFTS